MTNIRTRKPRILIEAPFIPATLDKQHVGTRVQFSSSTDFNDTSAMLYDKTTYAPDDILNIQITQQDGSPLEISLDDVYYFRYQLIYDSRTQPTHNPDQYTKDTFSVISSIYGDQEGFRYDHVIISTPLITVTEELGSLGNNFLVASATGYKTIVGSGKHKYTTWVVETSDGEEILRREKDSDNLEEVKFPMDLFKAGKLYNIKARFVSDTNGESNYGKCLYNASIARNEYMDVDASGDLLYGNDLFFKITTKIPNVTGVAAKLYSVVGNTEVEIPATITVNNRTIKVNAFTNINGAYSLTPSISITNIFKLVVRPIINGNSNVVWSNMITYTFMLGYPEVYPLDYSSNYPGQYTMLKDLNIGPTVMVTKELKNGTIPLMISGTKKVRIYSKYGNSIRPTNVDFDLPISYDNVVIPYINFIELYNGEIVINYAVLDNSNYKLSGWAYYSVDYSTNAWTLLASKLFDDEQYGTSMSSSAVVTRDNKILYIPDQYYTTGLDINPNVTRYFGCIDTDPVNEVAWSGGYDIYQSSRPQGSSGGRDFVVSNKHNGGSGTVNLEYNGDTIHALSLHQDGYVELQLNNNADSNGLGSNGYIELRFTIPKKLDANVSSVPGGYMGIFSWGMWNISIPYDDLTTKTFKIRFSRNSGTEILTGDYVRGTDIVVGIKCDGTILVDNVEVGNIGAGSGATDRGYLFKNLSQNEKTECYFKYIAFSITQQEIPFSYIVRQVKTYQDLPLMVLERNNSTIIRTKSINVIKPDIKKHMSLSPLSTDSNNEQFIIIGGTTNDAVEVDPNQPGIMKYALSNRNIGILSRAGSSWSVSWVQSNNLNVELPISVIPEDYYNLSAFRRYDGKIVIFNNSTNGPGSEDTSSFILDVSKITSTDLLEGWLVKDKNDSRIDLPFRSTIVMSNGDFIRTSYLETLVGGDLSCKVLLYPHQPLTDYTDTDAPVTINKNLIVPVGQVISVENAYLYDTITIEGDSPDNTGILIWTDQNGTRSFDYTYRFITRDTVTTTAEVKALGAEKFVVLTGVDWRVEG